RFVREAKAASALNHPNIVTIHEVGEDEAGRFIVMELVEGQTLRAIKKPCALETFFNLGLQIARALGATHAAGISHRDIKPDFPFYCSAHSGRRRLRPKTATSRKLFWNCPCGHSMLTLLSGVAQNLASWVSEACIFILLIRIVL